MRYTDDEIQNYALTKYGRFLTNDEMDKIRGSNVRSAAGLGAAIAGFMACANPVVGVAAALGASAIAKPAYNVAKSVPIVGDMLDTLEDIFG